MPYYLSRFDDVALPQRMTTDPVGPGSAPEAIVPTLGGALDVAGGEIRRPQRRVIRHEGLFVGEDGDTWVESAGNPVVESAGVNVMTMTQLSSLRGQYGRLARLWGRRGQLWRVRDDDGSEQWAWARLQAVGAEQDVEDAGARVLEVSCVFEAQDALWRSAAATVSSGSVNVPVAFFNPGEPVENAVLTITATTTLSGLDVRMGDAHLSFSGTVTGGTALVIDGGALTALNNGSDAYSNLVVEGDHLLAGWLRVEEGNNTLTVTATGGTGTVSLAWYEQWV